MRPEDFPFHINCVKISLFSLTNVYELSFYDLLNLLIYNFQQNVNMWVGGMGSAKHLPLVVV